MKETTNVFEENIHDSCLTEDCPHFTQHKSGYCTECRTVQCLSCKKVLVLSNDFDRKKPQCRNCILKKKKIK
jgi:hypothetical protein